MLVSFGVVSFFFSCEKDDICADQEITPYLIIRFTDVEDDSDPDEVSDLQVRYIELIDDGDDDETNDEYFTKDVYEDASDLDSITLALPTDKNNATYVFYQNYEEVDVEDEDGNIVGTEISTETETDTVTFTYNVMREYVSRACGFRATYNSLSVELISEGNPDGFIDNETIITNTVEDEEQAHVHFRH